MLEKAGKSIVLHLHVIPNAKKFEICSYSAVEHTMKVKVKSKAERNNANSELVKELSKMLGSRAYIIRGLKSRKKTVGIEKTETAINALNAL